MMALRSLTQVAALILGIAAAAVTSAQEDGDEAETQRQLRLLEWVNRGRDAAPLGKFIRVVSMWSDDRTLLTTALQTSVRCLRRPGTDSRIVVLAMHHYGDAEYFHALSPYCTDDSRVLCEGYDPDGAARGTLCDMLALVVRYQRGITARLNLVHQSTWKKTVMGSWWQPLDMPLRDVDRECASLPSAVVAAQRKLVALVEGDVSAAVLYEHLLANVATAHQATNPLEKLDKARENVIFDGLKRLIEQGSTDRIVLLYGAIHAAAVERRIVTELGYGVEWTLWNDVFRCSRKP